MTYDNLRSSGNCGQFPLLHNINKICPQCGHLICHKCGFCSQELPLPEGLPPLEVYQDELNR